MTWADGYTAGQTGMLKAIQTAEHLTIARITKENTMSETPVYDRVAAYMEPLMKSSERLGSARALLMVSQWISDEIKAERIKPNQDIKRILDALETIRTDILLKHGNRG